MTQPVLCIYRADDPDTLLAAWAVHHALPNAEFVVARRGEYPDHLDCVGIIDRDILILGDLYPLPTLSAMAAEARSVLVFSRELTPNDWAITDPTRAVCSIVLDYLHAHCTIRGYDFGPAEHPRIIDLIEDHALGERKAPKGPTDSSAGLAYGDDTRAFVAVLRSYDWTDLPAIFERLTSWQSWYRHRDDHDYWNNLLREGRAILRAERQRLAREGK